jgi:hypothetical protein
VGAGKRNIRKRSSRGEGSYEQYFGEEGDAGDVGEYFGDDGDIWTGAIEDCQPVGMGLLT